jgi:hypothetical protein
MPRAPLYDFIVNRSDIISSIGGFYILYLIRVFIFLILAGCRGDVQGGID